MRQTAIETTEKKQKLQQTVTPHNCRFYKHCRRKISRSPHFLLNPSLTTFHKNKKRSLRFSFLYFHNPSDYSVKWTVIYQLPSAVSSATGSAAATAAGSSAAARGSASVGSVSAFSSAVPAAFGSTGAFVCKGHCSFFLFNGG